MKAELIFQSVTVETPGCEKGKAISCIHVVFFDSRAFHANHDRWSCNLA